VTGEAVASGEQVQGRLLEPVSSGATTILVAYETTDNQDDYVNCQVGALLSPTIDGCFAEEGTLTVGNPGDLVTLTIPYTYNVLDDNQNGRTLQALSTTARDTMYECPSCPHVVYEKFYTYYTNFDYGNEWVCCTEQYYSLLVY
jgi:hypothetical protein